MNELKDHMNMVFQWVTTKGILCNEPLRGVRFNIVDVVMHADAIHRGAGQISPAGRNCMYASQLTGDPALYEPLFLAEVQVPEKYVGTVYSCFNQRRGKVVSEEKSQTSVMTTIKAHIPVGESFGFNEFLRSKTSGQAFLQCVFSHWELVNGDVNDVNSKIRQMIDEVRKQKDLESEIPKLENYLDKL